MSSLTTTENRQAGLLHVNEPLELSTMAFCLLV